VFLAALIATTNHEVSPDAALVQRLLQKGVSAFEQLYDRHSRIVYSLLLRILHLRRAQTPMEDSSCSFQTHPGYWPVPKPSP